jgi:PAS domain S-box-containing protein
MTPAPRGAAMSVATFTVVILASVTALVLGAVGVIGVRLHGSRAFAELRSAHRLLADQLAVSLVLPIWSFDRAQIDKVIEGAMNDRNAEAVVVRLRDVRSTVHARARDAAWRVVPGEGEPEEGGLVESRDVVVEGDVVGTVEVRMTTRFVEAEQGQALAWIGGTTAALTAFLVFGLYWLLWRTVLRPLKEVEALAASVSAESGGKELFHGKRYRGELEGLRTSLERMLGKLGERYDELRASEERLRESELLFRTVCSASPVAISVIGSDGRCAFANERWRAMSDAQSRGDRPWTDAVVAGEREEVARRWSDAVARRVALTLECSLGTSAGTPILARVSAVPLHAEPRGITGFLVTATDVSGVKQAEADARLRQITSQIHGAVFEASVEPDGRTTIAFASDGLDALIGPGWGAAPFRAAEFAARIHPEDRSSYLEVMGAGRAAQLELRFEAEPGRSRWLFFQGLPGPTTTAGRTWYHFVTDISERKAAGLRLVEVEREAKRALIQSAAELAASNALLDATNSELEAFSYSVSHDLRAPLRHIDGFGAALEDDDAGALSAVGRAHVASIRAATRRMGGLIDGLLGLARVTRAPMREDEVDLSALARELSAGLGRADPSRSVRWTIAPGLKARGDEPLLRVALSNLLENAWKYTSRRAAAHIEVGAAPEPDGALALFVRDDGVGFDMEHAGALFGAFQRLHRASEFPGDGIGLATVRRIVLRHGGRIRAEAARDAGATFRLVLPSLRQGQEA